MKKVLLDTAIALAHRGIKADVQYPKQMIMKVKNSKSISNKEWITGGRWADNHPPLGRGFTSPVVYLDTACYLGVSVLNCIVSRRISKRHRRLLKAYVHPKDIKSINNKRKLLIKLRGEY